MKACSQWLHIFCCTWEKQDEIWGVLAQVPAAAPASSASESEEGETGTDGKGKKGGAAGGGRKSSIEIAEEVAKDLRRDTREIPLSSPNVSSSASDSEEADVFPPHIDLDNSRFLQMSTATKVYYFDVILI